jgi:hypothetical protein
VFVTEVDGTQIRANFAGVVSIEGAVSLHGDVENKNIQALCYV